ncbi:MAG: thiamine pyrophosphate-dependent enzyme [Candidatus Muiribacteriota bacterium]
MKNSLLLTGNEAIARGAWEAGVQTATAYPGTPSTEILEAIKNYRDIYSEWSVNEKVAYEVAYGAAVAGKRAIVSMKQVGLNVAADPFFTSSYTGVNAGFVIITADEPGVFSSQNEQDNRNYAHMAKLPMLEPSDSEECRIFVKEAFEISEKFDTPVIVRLTTRICHTHSIVLPEERKEVAKKTYKKNSQKRAMIPIYALKRHEVVENRLKELQTFSSNISLNKVVNEEKKSNKSLIITSGMAFNHVMENGPDSPVLKLGMSYPLPLDFIAEIIDKFDKIIVVEENDDFLYSFLKQNFCSKKIVKKDEFFIINELNPVKVKHILDEKVEKKELDLPELPPRPPQMCPGCPHRAPFYLLSKHKIAVTGDIGCYGLGVLPPFSSMDTILCMGASVSMAHGFNLGGEKAVGVIGDSTFFHTGINSLINTYYNKGLSTVIILDNSITAMTGGQINPASTDDSVQNVSIESLVKAIGISYVKTINSFNVKQIEKEILDSEKNDELRVLIIKNPCIFIKKKTKITPKSVEREKCINCKLCLKVGCPAITVNDDGDVVILPEFCQSCSVCMQICPKGAIK